MACFVAPAAVAVATTVARKVVEKKEAGSSGKRTDESLTKLSGKWTRRLGWLNTMLWGGSALLAFEHLWHGEVVPWPPFLTALQTPGQVEAVLREIAVYGGAMTATIVVAWTVMVLVVESREKLRARAATQDGSPAGRSV